jgi:hypothetical protein
MNKTALGKHVLNNKSSQLNLQLIDGKRFSDSYYKIICEIMNVILKKARVNEQDF